MATDDTTGHEAQDTTLQLPVTGDSPDDTEGTTAPQATAAAGPATPTTATPPAGSTAPLPSAGPGLDPAPRPRPRIATVVWGLVVAALGVGVLIYAAGYTIDAQLALIVLLTVAGLMLLVGSLVGTRRGGRR
ncbi:hypothetical protein ACTHAM_000227 [Cellulomonas soli]|uniref:hypothetical protein n=1 Tax=Cellulomonas soli TaxID=931535 RepID=UPI003F83F83A